MTRHRHSPRTRSRSDSDLEFGPVFKVRKRRRHHRMQSGRLHLFLLFLWLRIVDSTMLLCVYPRLPIAHQRNLMLFLGATAVWTTGLLLAVWFRQNWAKYILVGSLLFTVVFTLSMIPSLPDVMHPRKELYAILGITAIYLPVALVLIISKHIQKLTEQDQFE
ncbi:MAG: hypothetical protein WCH57_07300 [Verrucomicrobiota bacterium]